MKTFGKVVLSILILAYFGFLGFVTFGGINLFVIQTPLRIQLDSNYQELENVAVSQLGSSKISSERRMIVHVGLQILQSKTLTYEYYYHCYSLEFSGDCTIPSTDEHKIRCYSLTKTIDTINHGTKFYSDCFGFARLTYCICAYKLNPTHPEQETRFNEYYGDNGKYSQSTKLTSPSLLKPGDVILDRYDGNRHVAIYIGYAHDKYIIMDQRQIRECDWNDEGYLTTPSSTSTPYKFNYYRPFG